MRTLHLENVPEDLYERIEQLAVAERLSPAETAVRLLEERLHERSGNGESHPAATRTQREILEDILRHPFRQTPGSPGVVDMLREDRER